MFSSWTWGRLEKRSFLVYFFLLDLGSAGEEKLSGLFIPLGPGVGWRRAFYGLIVIVYKLSILFLFSVLTVRETFILVFRVDG